MVLHLSLQLFGYQSWLDQDEDPTQVRSSAVASRSLVWPAQEGCLG
jgi:hypothetical protein